MDAPFIPDNEVQLDSPAPIEGQASVIPDDEVELDSENPIEQLKAGAEGVAHGLAGPLATLAETKVLGVPKENILRREKDFPITHGGGQALGLVGGALTGTGEAALLGKAGEAAVELSQLGEATSFAAKVGSSAVQQAAEMAILQGSDDTSKLILQDPEASTQTAIANMGLAAAMGAGTGALFTGAVSPLWKATAGPKIDEFLTAFKGHLDGSGKLPLPDAIQAAQQELGVDLPPAMRSAMSGDAKAAAAFNELRESQHPTIVAQMRAVREGSDKAVLDSLGIPIQDVAHYSENEAGHELFNTFQREYDAKYAPIAEALEKRNAMASTIDVPDEARLAQYGKIIEKGMEAVGTDSPYYKLYEQYGNRLLAKDTIGQIDKLKTEIFNKAKSMSADINEKNALHDIRNMMSELQESQIEKQAMRAEKEGAEFGSAIGQDIIGERAAANQQYAKFAKMSEELASHLGVGDFRGAGTLKMKLGEKLAPEQLLRKFSPKGNVDSIPFLAEHFPETLGALQQAEAKKFIAPSVVSELGESTINMKRLNAAIEKGMKGSPEYVKFALPEEALKKIQAAKVLDDAIPDFKSSGTAGWMKKLTRHWPSSAMASVGMFLGHNPITGLLIGEIGERLGKDAPDAVKLAMLNFLAADKPVEAGAFKASVDFMHDVIKGESLLNKSVNNVFKAGATVIPDSKLPTEVTRAKIDKMISQNQNKPDDQFKVADNDVGHYLPKHQMAIAQTSATVQQYLQALKPKDYQPSPLDRPIKPTAAQEARYNRALDIAQQPAIVLEHLKNGTLQASDIQDISHMYPGLYKNLVNKVSNTMISHHSDEEPIPYKTRMGLSLFMGQAIDSSMLPANIMAAQPKPQQPPQQQNASNKPKSLNSFKKLSNSYRTPGQTAEYDRAKRE